VADRLLMELMESDIMEGIDGSLVQLPLEIGVSTGAVSENAVEFPEHGSAPCMTRTEWMHWIAVSGAFAMPQSEPGAQNVPDKHHGRQFLLVAGWVGPAWPTETCRAELFAAAYS